MYIHIYSYKKIKYKDQIIDIIHREEVANAIANLANHDEYEILSGKYKGKYIPKLTKNFQNQDFVAMEVTEAEIKLAEAKKQTHESLEESIAQIQATEYYQLKYNEELDHLSKREIFDLIIEQYAQAIAPSTAKELTSLIAGSGNDSFTIPASLTSKLLNKTNSLLTQDANTHRKSFQDYKVKEKYASLRRKIIGLDEELKSLLTNITKNITLSYSGLTPDKIQILKSGIIIIGGSGTGKSFMIKNVAKEFDVPYTIEDATRYTPNAYQGEDLENILVNLYFQNDENKELYEHSIIFLDEFDKICKKGDPKDNALRESVQNTLLTIMEGTVINKKVRIGLTEKVISIDTSKMTFVLSGAFEELTGPIDYESLVKYGMIPQLANRLNCLIVTKEPTIEDLKTAITSSEYSYLELLREYLEIYGIDLAVESSFVDEIAALAYQEKSGYRGIPKAINQFLNEKLYPIYAGQTHELKLSADNSRGNKIK